MIDTHVHVWDRTCRIINGAAYRPARAAAPYDEIRTLWDGHGTTAGVLVQPSFLGTDNGFLLQTLASDPGRLRGVIIADPAQHADALHDMHAAGVRGIRFNLISGGPLPDMSNPVWRDFLARARSLGWHVVIAGRADIVVLALPHLRQTGLPVVIDHYGMPAGALGESCPAWQAAVRAAECYPIWFKLSAPYRVAESAPDRLTAALLQRPGPDRLLWGSDWPWTRHESGRSFDEAVSTIQGNGGSTVLREACRRNAVALYGFDPAP